MSLVLLRKIPDDSPEMSFFSPISYRYRKVLLKKVNSSGRLNTTLVMKESIVERIHGLQKRKQGNIAEMPL